MTLKTWLAAGILAAAGGTPGSAAPDDPLAPYRWTSRLIVIAAPDAGDPRVAAQRGILAAARTGARARDLAVVEAIGPGGSATALRRALGLPDDAFRAVLVGKDGGAKLRRSEPIPADLLFETIDAMPMRREEARERR